MAQSLHRNPLVIQNGSDVSAAFRPGGFVGGSVQLPAAMTGNQFTVEVSNDGSSWSTLQNAAGTAIAVMPFTANESCMLPAETFHFDYARLKSSASEGAERTLLLYMQSA